MSFCSTTQAAILHQFQICLHGPGRRALQLPEAPKCVLPMEFKHKRIEITLYTPSHNWPHSEAFLCYMETTRVCTSTSFFGGKGLVDPGSVSRKPTKIEDCKLASSHLTYNGTRLVQDLAIPTVWSTNRVVEPEYRWWRTFCSKEVNFVLEKGDVASQDGVSIISSLISTDPCKLKEGYCLFPEATLISSLRSIRQYCPYEVKGRYNAVVNMKFLSVPELEAAFHLTNRYGISIHNCLPKQALLTKEGEVVYLGLHPGHLALETNDSTAIASQPTEAER